MVHDSTVTGKNQITIPAEVVRAMQLEPGVKIQWQVQNDLQSIVLRKKPNRSELVSKLAGIGRDWLKPGEDPIAELIRERVEDDRAEDLP